VVVPRGGLAFGVMIADSYEMAVTLSNGLLPLLALYMVLCFTCEQFFFKLVSCVARCVCRAEVFNM
jgi:hypothetical protein